MPISETKNLSDIIAGPLIKIYKTGNFALVFIFTGLLLVLYAHFDADNKFSFLSFLLGAVLIFLSFLLFLFNQLKNVTKPKNVRKGQEMVDNLQSLSINLVIMAGKLQSFSFKYIKEADVIMSAVSPYLKDLPFVPEKIRQTGLKVKDLQSSLVSFTAASEQTIQQVEKALVTYDIRKFKAYALEIEHLNKQLSEYLKK